MAAIYQNYDATSDFMYRTARRQWKTADRAAKPKVAEAARERMHVVVDLFSGFLNHIFAQKYQSAFITGLYTHEAGMILDRLADRVGEDAYIKMETVFDMFEANESKTDRGPLAGDYVELEYVKPS